MTNDDDPSYGFISAVPVPCSKVPVQIFLLACLSYGFGEVLHIFSFQVLGHMHVWQVSSTTLVWLLTLLTVSFVEQMCLILLEPSLSLFLLW